jgi:hypothetical protein
VDFVVDGTQTQRFNPNVLECERVEPREEGCQVAGGIDSQLRMLVVLLDCHDDAVAPRRGNVNP